MDNEEEIFSCEEELINTIDKPAHAKVREAFLDMEKASGSAIKPFGLFKVFYKLLQSLQPNKMNRVKARNVADVFSALQNECFVINFNGKNDDWFYMTTKRWQKYGLGRKAIYNSVIFLKYCGIIETEIRQHPLKEQNDVRYYKFNLKRLKDIVERVSFDSNRKNS